MSPKAIYSVRAVDGFTRAYVQALAASLVGRTVTRAEVCSVTRHEHGVDIAFEGGEVRGFDRVVFACGADQAHALLSDATEDERRLLGAWKYKEGRVVVHRDHACFPPQTLTQAYTFLYTQGDGVLNTSVNGSLRHEPGVSPRCDLIASQHPNFPIDPDTIELDAVLRTPMFDFDAVATIDALPGLNGARRSYFCGSYFGHGLHEDAVRSAVDVARHLGVEF